MKNMARSEVALVWFVSHQQPSLYSSYMRKSVRLLFRKRGVKRESALHTDASLQMMMWRDNGASSPLSHTRSL